MSPTGLRGHMLVVICDVTGCTRTAALDGDEWSAPAGWLYVSPAGRDLHDPVKLVCPACVQRIGLTFKAAA